MATILFAESCDMGAPANAATITAHDSIPIYQIRTPTTGGYKRTETLLSPPSYSTAIKKTGTGSWRFSGGGQADSQLLYTATTNWGTTLYLGWWFYIPTGAIASGDIYQHATLSDGSQAPVISYGYNVVPELFVSLGIASAGGIILAFDTWYWAELRYVAGVLTLYVNGVAAVQTISAMTGNITTFKIGSYSHEGTKDVSDLYVDGLICSNDTALAYADGWVVLACVPDADDATDSAFTPSTGSQSFSLIEEAPPNTGGAADYVSSTAVSQNELVGVNASAIPSTATNICVKTVLHITPTTSGDAVDLFVRTKDGAAAAVNNAMEATLTADRTYQYAVIDNVRPNGGGAWAQADVDAFLIGGARGANVAKTANLSIDQAFIEVVYKPAVAAAGQPILRRSAQIPHMALGQTALRRRY